MNVPNADDYIHALLAQHNRDLGEILNADILSVKSPISSGLDNNIRLEIEKMCGGETLKRPRLSVILETEGGFIEVVERIYAVFRTHYMEVDFIVPNYAYSAGTVLALSGDRIFMDYYSVLGPIDPQIQGDNGNFVPGMGYLVKFSELVADINSAKPGESKTAELAYLTRRFDPAMLFALEQAKSHSESLLEEWLPLHKFKNSKKTKTGRRSVTPEMRKDRAKEIAKILGNAERWHSHGRGIGLKELTNDEIKLIVDDFGKDEKLAAAIHSYHNLLIDFCQKTGVKSALHSKLGLRRMT